MRKPSLRFMTPRGVLGILGVLLVLLAGQVWADEEPRTFYFIQMADTQIVAGDPSVAENYRKVATQINALDPQPALSVICGDLINHMQSCKTGTDERDREWATFAEITNTIKTPVFAGLGNHDIHTGWSPHTEQDIRIYHEKWFPMLRTKGQREYFAVTYGSAIFILFNGNRFLVNRGATERMAEEHLAWIEKNLRYAEKKGLTYRFLINHYPPFMKTPDDPTSRWRITPLEPRRKLLALIRKHKVTAVLSGHLHRSMEREYEGIPLITNGSVSPKHGGGARGYRIIVLTPQGMRHRFVDFTRPRAAAEFLAGFRTTIAAETKRAKGRPPVILPVNPGR